MLCAVAFGSHIFLINHAYSLVIATAIQCNQRFVYSLNSEFQGTVKCQKVVPSSGHISSNENKQCDFTISEFRAVLPLPALHFFPF